MGRDHANGWAGGGVDSRIDGVGFAPSGFFVENEQARIERTAVDGAQRRGSNVGNVQYAGDLKLIRLCHLFHGGVVRSIVDDDDFKVGVFEPEQRSNAATNRSFLVVRRSVEGEGGGERRRFHQLQALAAQAMTMTDILNNRNDEQRQVNDVGKDVVDE